jgi:predicted cupin superfamily sugar epimerase
MSLLPHREGGFYVSPHRSMSKIRFFVVSVFLGLVTPLHKYYILIAFTLDLQDNKLYYMTCTFPGF